MEAAVETVMGLNGGGGSEVSIDVVATCFAAW